jgi:hypothetical protein
MQAARPALTQHTTPLKVTDERSFGMAEFIGVEIKCSHAAFQKARVILAAAQGLPKI